MMKSVGLSRWFCALVFLIVMPQSLVLHWDRRQLCGLLAEHWGGRPQIRQAFAQAWPDDQDPMQSPGKSAEMLKSWLDSQGAAPKQVVVCLSREDVILRHLEVPDVPEDELAALVAFQATARSTLPLNQLVLDFLPLPMQAGHEGRPVLAVTAPKSLANGLQAVFQAAGLEVTALSFSSIGLAEFIAQTEQQLGHDARQAVLAVLWDGARVELVILANRQVLYAHSARISAEEAAPVAGLLAEVSRTIVAAQRLHPSLSIHHAWILDDGVASPGLVSQLTERLGAPAEVLEPTGIGWAEMSLDQLPGNPGLFAALLGLSVPDADRLTAAFDFLHPRRPPKPLDRRKQRIMAGSAAALVIAALGMGAIQWTKSSLEREMNGLRSREADLDLKIKPGQAALAAAKLIDDWQSGNLPQLQHLSALKDLMEGTDRLYLSQYAFTAGTGDSPGNLQSFGNAKSRDDIQQFYQRLIDTKLYRIQPRGLTQSSRDDEYPQRFELNAEILPKQKPAVTPEG